MPLPRSAAAEVFSVVEIAEAAGVSAAAVNQLIAVGAVRAVDGYLPGTEAVRSVRLLRRAATGAGQRQLFAPGVRGGRSPVSALAASGALHAAMLGVFALVTTIGFTPARELPKRLEPARLVFLATPGPGGGGGGGGLKQPKLPPRAEMKGTAKLKSPVPPPTRRPNRPPEREVRRPAVPVAPRPAPDPVEPPAPPLRPVVTPQVVAPVVMASSDPSDRAGALSDSSSEADTHGSGSGAGVGTGQGTGIGEGSGAGIGPGSGGGTGGGPYRPGSGVTAPDLLKEVRPHYTEDARRQGIEGDVLLEIVVRADGSVGDVNVVQGLGGGLNRNAIDAVRQWRFSPARRHGAPVDVMVEVAVAFKLR